MTAEFKGLVRSLHGTLTAGEASEVLEFVDAQDLSLAVQALCGILLDGEKRVTPETYTRIHSLVRQIDGVDSYLIESVRAIVRAE
ncbi:MAG TPA: MafI family immunity protein [Candidatus Acidoferrum sp.]|nr:MafI family immunity protein [Candidatus Acidoferrum sp.]